MKNNLVIILILSTFLFVSVLWSIFFINYSLNKSCIDSKDIHKNLKLLRGETISIQKQSQHDYDVTLISQSSFDRFMIYIQHIAQRWNGPISIATVVYDDEDKITLNQYIKQSLFYNNLHIEIYFETKDIYPINLLRNIAIKQSKTSHYFLTDIDLWPSSTLYSSLINLPLSILSQEKQAIIIPAFELKVKECNSIEDCYKHVMYRIPSTYDELHSCIYDEQCGIFKEKILTHNSTDYYTYWKLSDASSTPNIYPFKCFDNDGYEPYVMVKQSHSLPHFDERFYNYGMNKLLFIYELRVQNYKFSVLTRDFIIHIPHPITEYAKRIKTYHQRIQLTDMDEIMKSYIQSFKTSGKDLKQILPICKGSTINRNSIWNYI